MWIPKVKAFFHGILVSYLLYSEVSLVERSRRRTEFSLLIVGLTEKPFALSHAISPRSNLWRYKPTLSKHASTLVFEMP
jgi:hypothetical protein